MKKLVKLLALTLASRHGHGPMTGGYKPWKKRKKWKAHRHYGYGPYDGHPGYPPPPYGYGHPRPRGIKGVIVEAILHRLLRR